MTRLGMAVMCGPAFVLSVFVGLTQGNPLAWGLAIGFAAPVVGTVGTALLLGATRPKPAPRKADPAKIARLERELGVGPELPNMARTHAATMAEWDAVTSEAPTTIVQPYAGPPHLAGWPEEHERHCPRPEGCVIAHPCRKCGADRGQACVGDPYAATFHGAPTFGHKIEGP